MLGSCSFDEKRNKISKIFEINKVNKFKVNEDFWKKIENHEIYQNVNIERLNEDELVVYLCAFAIDIEDLKLFDYLFNKFIKDKNVNIISEIYETNYLTIEGLEFILEKKNNSLKVTFNICLQEWK